MSITELRNALIDDIKDNVDFTYDELEPQVKVYRYNEGFSKKNPKVLIQFLPSNRKKFQSVGDAIGKAQGDYYRYGYARIEVCTIHCYSHQKQQKSDKTSRLNGRILCEDMINKCQQRVLKVWENILFDYYASFDRRDTIPMIKDFSYYDERTETMIYNYDIDVYLRIPFAWDKVPDDYDEDGDLAQVFEVESKESNTEIKKNIIIKQS